MTKRAGVVLGLAAFIAAPAAAQWAGVPAWNDPKSGTGVTISGDFGKPNTGAGKGTAFGTRAALGLGPLTLALGITSWEPEALNERTTSFGGTAAFRVIGGSLLPVAINLQAGAATSGEITSGTGTLPKMATVTGAIGLSVNVPTPGLSIEPYFSPGLRYHRSIDVLPGGGDDSETNLGFTIGANLGLGLFGIHLAYDSEKFDDGTTHGVFGIGAHIGLRPPLGM